MSVEGQPSSRLQAYLKQLTQRARSRLLNELERLHQIGEDIPGSGGLLATLRAEFPKATGGPARDRAGDPARFFFLPLEPVLTNTPSADSHAGQISRASLPAVWEWIDQLLLPAMTSEYESKIKPAIAADRQRDVEQIAATFRSKVVKCLEGIFADPSGVERTRAEFSKFTTSPSVVIDVEKILWVLKAKDALAQFHASLPKEIAALKGKTLSDLHQRLETLRGAHPHAIPFALYMIVRRLKAPCQLIRIPLHDARGKPDIVASPYAFAFAAVLGIINDQRLKLLQALKQNHALAARAVLVAIYDFEYELRASIARLDQPDWNQQLDRLMTRVGNDLDAELHKLPDNLHHVLGSESLQRRDGLAGWLNGPIMRLRDAALDLPSGLSQRVQALIAGRIARN